MNLKSSLFFGRNILREALAVKAPISEVYYETESAKKFAASLYGIKSQNIPLIPKIPSEFKNQSHQGIAFQTTHPFYQKFSAGDLRKFPFVILCNHIEDIHNFGSIARCAAGFGAGLIIHEEKNSAELTAAAMKSSAGLAFRISFMKVSNLNIPLKELKAAGFNIVGLDVDKSSVNLFEWVPTFPLALVLGSEGSGMEPAVKKECDTLVRIAMEAKAESLNVSHAAAIAMNWAYRAANINR
ncbi:MAG: putative tRNA/rRNA methyltransferase Mvan [Bacteriovoracaceae bacterium]|nr:putative tRNA/rRNA methyltransferase Mvan [Bacteriovoracaceae bacterium]